MIKLNLNLLLLFLLSIFTISTSSSYSESEKFYNELVKDWPKIFPDSNRNAAGPKCYNHILKKYRLSSFKNGTPSPTRTDMNRSSSVLNSFCWFYVPLSN